MKMKNDGLIIRSNKRENPYVMIDKHGLNDERLSWKAKGLLAYLLSKPDDWTVYVSDLIKRSKDGEDSVRAGLKELRDNGYVSMERIRNDKGVYTGTQYIVYEQPIEIEAIQPHGENPDMAKPFPENPDVGFPDVENPVLLINDLNKNDRNKNERMKDAADASPGIVPDEIFEELYKAGKEIAVGSVEGVTGVYVLAHNANDLEEIYISLKKQFPNQMSKETIQLACDLFVKNYEKGQRKDPGFTITNPVGWFLYNYGEAIKQYKANVKKQEMSNQRRRSPEHA